jgi:hypothetical protein
MWLKNCFLFLLTSCLAVSTLAEEYVIEDDGVGMSLEELSYLVQFWSPDMQQAAANDPGDRIELLNMSLAAKKIAREADKVTRESNPREQSVTVLVAPVPAQEYQYQVCGE